MSELASESGHWYWPTGEPCFSCKGAKGQDVTPDIRHARKLGLYPGVTSITRLLAAPGLTNWMIDQAIMSALTLPRHEGETDEEFVSRVKFDSKERGKKAAERGTELHADIERAIRKEPHGHAEHIKAIMIAMFDLHGLDLYAGTAEHSFAHPHGFGGKIDYHYGDFIADFKSKDRIEDKKLAYDEHAIQLAAYCMGLGIKEPVAYNIFVGIEDAKVHIHQWTPAELQRGERMFIALLVLWKEKNKIT